MFMMRDRGVAGSTGMPAFSLRGGPLRVDDPELLAQVLFASLRYPLHERVLALLFLLSLGVLIALWGGLGEGAAMTASTALGVLVALGALALFGGERALLWGWRLASRLARKRLPVADARDPGSLRLYEDRLEWGGGPGRPGGGSAPYSRVAYALLYGDLLLVYLRMTPHRPPELVADASGLGEGGRAEASRFLEGRVGAARRTREYRRSAHEGSWATDAFGRLACALWRWTLAALGAFLVVGGAVVLAEVAVGAFPTSGAGGLALGVSLALGGATLLDGITAGRTVCFLRRHPTRRRFRVGRMRRVGAPRGRREG